MGLTIAAFASAFMSISGGQFNPAVTLGLMAARKLRPVQGMAYILVQLAGACFGAYGGSVTFNPSLMGNVAAKALPNLAPGYHPAQGYLVEIVLTFILMFVIYGTAVQRGALKKVAGLFIGLTVTLCILTGSHISGAVMNPAVWFGLSSTTGALLTDRTLTYTVGPIFGALIASCLWAYVLESEEDEE